MTRLATLEAAIFLAILVKLLCQEAVGAFVCAFFFLFLFPILFVIFAGLLLVGDLFALITIELRHFTCRENLHSNH